MARQIEHSYNLSGNVFSHWPSVAQTQQGAPPALYAVACRASDKISLAQSSQKGFHSPCIIFEYATSNISIRTFLFHRGGHCIDLLLCRITQL